MSRTVRVLVDGDLSLICAQFAKAGLSARSPAPGILQVTRPSPGLAVRMRLLLSAGIHGDETAPIELLAQLLDEIAAAPDKLGVDLMAVIGNPAAIAQGKRFIDADLNRLFRAERGDMQFSTEAQRADTIMQAAVEFLEAPASERWHLDLHTAIRASRYATFAIVPGTVGSPSLLAWLGQAEIEAAILSPSSAATFSAYTATHCGAVSATVELGQVSALGMNDLSCFAAVSTALAALVCDGRVERSAKQPQVFRVIQELVKKSDAFSMTLGRDAQNFTPMQPGEIIATDVDTVYRVGAQTEYVIFPNPDVRVGLRAGLMAVRDEPPSSA